MLVASLGVTSSSGSNCQAVLNAKRVNTVLGCDYYFTYNTILSLITYIIAIIAKKEFAIWPGIH
jgi:energy-converting hydrogenase Eha subunit E